MPVFLEPTADRPGRMLPATKIRTKRGAERAWARAIAELRGPGRPRAVRAGPPIPRPRRPAWRPSVPRLRAHATSSQRGAPRVELGAAPSGRHGTAGGDDGGGSGDSEGGGGAEPPGPRSRSVHVGRQS